jgi:hypothetical protein
MPEETPTPAPEPHQIPDAGVARSVRQAGQQFRIIQARKRLRSVKPRNEVGMSEKCRIFSSFGIQVLAAASASSKDADDNGRGQTSKNESASTSLRL